MKKIETLVKLYNVPPENLKKSIESLLKNEFEELNVQVKSVEFTKDKLAEISVEGEDEEIASNFIKNSCGKRTNIADIKEKEVYIGRIEDIGQVNFGLFVDIGAYIGEEKEKIDALYPLFEIRKQLGKNKTIPLKKIVKSYGLVENLPLTFEVTEKKVLGRKLRVKLTEESINWLMEPFKQKTEALIITGATTKMIKDALKRTKHSQDVEVIERISFLEHRLICKKNTRAEGLIPEIGYLLGEAKIAIQSTKRMKELMSLTKE